MITPPFNILANPALTAKLVSPSWAPWPFVVGSSVAIVDFLKLRAQLGWQGRRNVKKTKKGVYIGNMK